MQNKTPQERAHELARGCLELQNQLPKGLWNQAVEAAAHLVAIEGYFKLHEAMGLDPVGSPQR
jgi:hypothetical protein